MRSSPATPPPSGPTGRTKILMAIFTVSGIGHLFVPRIFDRIIPRWMPKGRLVIFLSGVAELACAAGLATEASWAGPASAAVLVGIWPAHFQMSYDEYRNHSPKLRQLALLARIPMQIPMIRIALDA